jgi:hypothetical protein
VKVEMIKPKYQKLNSKLNAPHFENNCVVHVTITLNPKVLKGGPSIFAFIPYCYDIVDLWNL